MPPHFDSILFFLSAINLYLWRALFSSPVNNFLTSDFFFLPFFYSIMSFCYLLYFILPSPPPPTKRNKNDLLRCHCRVNWFCGAISRLRHQNNHGHVYEIYITLDFIFYFICNDWVLSSDINSILDETSSWIYYLGLWIFRI